MNIEAHKNQLIKKLIEVQDETLLDKIEAILNNDLIIGQTIDGDSLTKSQYIAHIESISQSVADGAETYTSEEVRASILSKKK
ncbi:MULTISPECIES: hypothetical protein [unclassified Flavobacterium]|uniref:hypothetical protein n=1 Tax=unclassified Flavobacterium TaxID=196869 RepID=UPI003F9387D5